MFLPINYFCNIFKVIIPWEKQNHFNSGIWKYWKIDNQKAESLKVNFFLNLDFIPLSLYQKLIYFVDHLNYEG